MTYWEALDVIENGSVHYGKVLEASAVAAEVLKEKVKQLDKAEDAEFKEVKK